MNTPTASSQKANALIALYELGGSTRELEPVLNKMREKGITSDIHNLAHVMWPLSKENLVTFLERKTGPRHSSTLTNISLTERGKDRAMALLGLATGFLPNMSGRGRSAHAVGQDATDYRRHSDVAVGGPIEVIKKENPLDSIPYVVLDAEEAAKYRGSAPTIGRPPKVIEPPRQNERVEVAPAVAPIEETAKVADTPGEYVTLGERMVDRSGYPEIAAVLAKADKVARFTKAAELLGDDEAELAITILERVKISPLEAEIIKLLG